MFGSKFYREGQDHFEVIVVSYCDITGKGDNPYFQECHNASE